MRGSRGAKGALAPPPPPHKILLPQIVRRGPRGPCPPPRGPRGHWPPLTKSWIRLCIITQLSLAQPSSRWRETPSQLAHDHLSFRELAHGELSSHKNKKNEICKLVLSSAQLSSAQACSRAEKKRALSIIVSRTAWPGGELCAWRHSYLSVNGSNKPSRAPQYRVPTRNLKSKFHYFSMTFPGQN